MKVYVVDNSDYWGKWVFSTKRKAMNFLLKWIQEDYKLENFEMPEVEKQLLQTDCFDSWHLYEAEIDKEN